MPTDIQYKDSLRKDLIIYEEWMEMINNNDIDKLKQQLQAQIDRINASLQD